MNGTESLLLIIVGILSIRFSFYLMEDEGIPHDWEKKMNLFIAAYAWIAFIAGNIMFFYWLINK